MIWLSKKDSNERDTITCNMFVSSESNLKLISELKKELMDSKKYILSSADVIRYYGELYDVNNGNERLENQKITNKYGENIYLRRGYTNPRISSLEVLLQIGLSKEEQLKTNINLLKMFNNELIQIDIMEKLFIFFHEEERVRFFMNSIWQDFYFFAKEIYDLIELEEISNHDILDLEDIQRLCKKNNIQDNCSEILIYKDVANSNERILKLAKKLNDNEKWWKEH